MNVHSAWPDATERVFAIGGTLVVVTHSPELAARLRRRSVLVDGYLKNVTGDAVEC